MQLALKNQAQEPSKSAKHHKNLDTLGKIKSINYAALFIDLAAIIVLR